MATIAELAKRYNTEPYEIAAALDLGKEGSDHDEIDSFEGWTEAEAIEVLDIMEAQHADRL